MHSHRHKHSESLLLHQTSTLCRMPNFTCFRGICHFSSLPAVSPHLQRFSLSSCILSVVGTLPWWDPGWGRILGSIPHFPECGAMCFQPMLWGQGGSRNLFVRAHLESLSNPHCLSACPSVTEVLIIFPTIRFY